MGPLARRTIAWLLAAGLCLGATLPAAAGSATADESIAYEIDPGHGGSQPADSLTPPLAVKWSVDVGVPLSYPVIGGGAIFVTTFPAGTNTDQTQLFAFDAKTGQRRWGPVSLGASYGAASLAYDRVGGVGRVFATNSTNAPGYVESFVSAFDPLTGTSLWQDNVGFDGVNAPLPENGTLFVNTGGNLAIDEITGAIKMTWDGVWPVLAATAGGLYSNYYQGKIIDYSPAGGATIWETENCCDSGFQGYPVVSGGRLYVTSAARDSTLPTVRDASSGAELGHFNANAPPVIDGSIGIFQRASVINAEDLATGTPLWSFTGDCDIYMEPVAANGILYIASAHGNIYGLNERTGALVWSNNVGARLVGEGQNSYYYSPSGSLPALAIGEGLLAVPAGTRLVVYASAPGSAWTPAPISAQGPSLFQQHPVPYPAGSVPPPRPTELVNGPDGNLWFIEPLARKIAKMTPAGAVTEYRVVSSVPNLWLVDLTAGPDGALWFTEQNAYKIGRITTDGVITEFATPVDRNDIPPGAPAGPFGITSGPDGALWFTNLYGSEIDRMTTTGTVTAVLHLPLGTGPRHLTFGPDGNIWFTEPYYVGRVATDGSGYVHFQPPKYYTVTEEMGRIIPGPDGNMWFTEDGGDDPTSAQAGFGGGVGRITMDGTITDWQVPTPASAPLGITVGPDGNLWFTENQLYFYAPNKLGRITPQGQIREYWIHNSPTAPYTGGPWGITVGPDGALWFSEAVGNAIARFDISSPPCPAPPPSASTVPARLPAPEHAPGSVAPGNGANSNRTGPPPPVPQRSGPPQVRLRGKGRRRSQASAPLPASTRQRGRLRRRAFNPSRPPAFPGHSYSC